MASFSSFHRCHFLTFQFFPSDLAKNPIDLVSVGLADESNVYDWEILIMGPDGTLYEGGFFKARLVFPPDFPNMPRECFILYNVDSG